MKEASASVVARSEFIIANGVEEIMPSTTSFIISALEISIVGEAKIYFYQMSFISWSRVPTRKIHNEKVLFLSKYKCANLLMYVYLVWRICGNNMPSCHFDP